MRKIILGSLFLFIFVGNVYALGLGKTATQSSQKREEKQAALQQKIDAKRLAIQEKFAARKEVLATKAAERKLQLTEQRRELIRKYFLRMLARFQAAIARMVNIADRIESRLDKMEERGITVTALRDNLQVARDDIEVAKGLLSGLEEKLENVLAGDDPKTAFEEIRDTIQETRDLLKGIHQKLVAIIVAMKGPQTGVNRGAKVATPSATPTATSSAESE